MQNKVWNEIGMFLNGLRCGNVERESYIQLPELTEAEREKSLVQEAFQTELESMEAKQRDCVENYMEILEHLAFVEEEQAYCQGYIDCIQLLAGLGMLKELPDIKKLVEKIKN